MKITNNKVIVFEKKDDWDRCLFYEVKIIDNEKFVIFQQEFNRMPIIKNGIEVNAYLYRHHLNLTVEMEKLIEWDAEYYLANWDEFQSAEWTEGNPQDVFALADLALCSNKGGRTELYLRNLSEETEVGLYFY